VAWGPAAGEALVSRSRLLDKSRSRLLATGEPPQRQLQGGEDWDQENFVVDRYPMMSYGQTNKGEYMAIDFDALDLVRGENKSRSYNTKLDGLQQQVTELTTLVAQMVKELPMEKKWSFEERLKKIKERP
jgi:hypothetical protein